MLIATNRVFTRDLEVKRILTLPLHRIWKARSREESPRFMRFHMHTHTWWDDWVIDYRDIEKEYGYSDRATSQITSGPASDISHFWRDSHPLRRRLALALGPSVADWLLFSKRFDDLFTWLAETQAALLLQIQNSTLCTACQLTQGDSWNMDNCELGRRRARFGPDSFAGQMRKKGWGCIYERSTVGRRRQIPPDQEITIWALRLPCVLILEDE